MLFMFHFQPGRYISLMFPSFSKELLISSRLNCYRKCNYQALINYMHIVVFFLKNRHTKQKKSASIMLHISALQSQVVKGRQLLRHSIHAHFTYPRTAWAQTHGFPINTLGGIKLKFPSVRLLVFAHSACRYKVLCEVLPRAVNIILYYFFFPT